MHPVSELAAALWRARSATDELFGAVRPEALFDRPIPERHRIVFYIGHLEAFDWNLCRDTLGRETFQPLLDGLFAFGIDPEVGKALTDTPMDWPNIGEVRSYCRRVRRAFDEALSELPKEIVHAAIEHRWMHAETFAYILHAMPLERKSGRCDPAMEDAAIKTFPLIEIPEGTATLGRLRSQGFGWDNEFEACSVNVPAFRIGKHKVTNGEYLKFVNEGAPAPHFWLNRGDAWYWRAMFGEIPLPLDWPVYVTRDEAVEYANWAGKSLPSEAQFHRAAYGTYGEEEREFPWGGEAPSVARGNFDAARWDPVPVNANTAGESAFGVAQLVGNGWEWTDTVFGPFPGFEPRPYYPGYSANFFDGAHYVIKGGGPRTAAPLLRRSFRNWFRSDYPYVHAGFRLVEN